MKTIDRGALADRRVDGQRGFSGSARGFPVPQLGSVRFLFDEARWDWSPTVAHIHGYRLGTTAPDTGQLLSHIHPDDRSHVESLLQRLWRTPQPFSTHHRIIDTHNRVHDVVVIGAPIYRSGGDRAAVGMQCSCVDLTAATSPADAVREQPRSTAEYGYTDDEDWRRRIRAATRC